MNVLVTSISNKIPMLKAVRHALERSSDCGVLFGADADSKCLGVYFVDQFWLCPRLHEGFIDELLQYCLKNRISVIFPSRDGELKYLAIHKEKLRQHQIYVMISAVDAVQFSLDKLLFCKKLQTEGFPAIPTFLQYEIGYEAAEYSIVEPRTIGHITFEHEAYVVKERFGAGARLAGIQISADRLDHYIRNMEHPVIQPFIEGKEYSVDMYVSDRQVVGSVVRQRVQVVNGESRITQTVRHEKLERLCMRLSELYEFHGHIMFQVIQDAKEQFHVIECNCRFGGASTLSVAAGLDSFYWFMQECAGITVNQLEFKRAEREIMLLRHPEDYLL